MFWRCFSQSIIALLKTNQYSEGHNIQYSILFIYLLFYLIFSKIDVVKQDSSSDEWDDWTSANVRELTDVKVLQL